MGGKTREESLRAECSQLLDALRVGKQALEHLGWALRSLRNARRFGVLDLLGGGLFTTALKHDEVDQARGDSCRAQTHLEHFQALLASLDVQADFHAELRKHSFFADYVLDGVIFDCIAQSKIKSSAAELKEIQEQVVDLLQGLAGRVEAVDFALEQLAGDSAQA
ncbi:MAG: hypothetical protein ACI9HE_000847 [Planctomycetota bacterium]|jgi:hypothetical protein